MANNIKRNIKTVMENDHQSVRHVVFITSFWKKAICFLYCIDLTNMLVICFGHKYIHSRSPLVVEFANLMFRSSHFWFLVTFGDKTTKIFLNLCSHFARQDGQDGKKPWKKITQLKWPKYQKPKDENMGWTKHWSGKYLQISQSKRS